MKTYGTLGWAQNPTNGLAYYGLELPPHVTIKAKRLFPRIAQARTDMLTVLDTPEIAADLVWFMERYPLDMTDDVRERLARQAATWHSEQEEIELVIGGKRLLTEHRQPARPARDYQIVGANLAYLTGGLLLGDDVGLGKTQTALMLLADPTTLPALIVVPTHLPIQWQNELREVWPDVKTHIVTNGSPIIRRKRKAGIVEVPYDTEGADVLIMSYSKLAGWRHHLAGQIKTVIFDEVQELRRSDSEKYQAAAAIADKSDRRMGLSATPIYNYGGEAYNIFEVLKPGVLGTRYEFLREWAGSTSASGNVVVEDTNALGAFLRDQGLMLRRSRAELGRLLPEPILPVVEVDSHTTEIEKVDADLVAIAERVLHGSRVERFTASGELDMRMRQATGIDKAPFVADFTRMLLDSEQKVVMFGWHRTVYDIWNQRLADMHPVMYTGSESPRQKAASVEQFIEDEKARIFICSLRSGAGLDGLQKVASVGVFGELDWSPAIHHQAIGRLARDGQPGTAVGYFLVSREGSDPIIGGVLEAKRQQAEPFMTPDKDQALFAQQSDGSDRVKALARSVLAKAGRRVD